ncbi:MAG: hypothetical protein IJ219_06310 [Bacteroidaceae bacterium]|nr:hypothetical protein [Bacteroidaceae bacterium]MBQ9170955.1 hypothetical protein [Bacteroidaceae bacterium]MBQ9294524.1 hypothetical protein [Bacteroidaceae bacterium]
MTQRIVPTAVNTVNSVRLNEMNLQHGTDYNIINTVTADATVFYSTKKKGQVVILEEENGECWLEYKFDSQQEKWGLVDFEGVARYGFLSNDEGRVSLREINPEDMARNIAIYRLINASKVRGADGVIEPVISTNVDEREGKIVFKTTVSAKLMKLNVDSGTGKSSSLPSKTDSEPDKASAEPAEKADSESGKVGTNLGKTITKIGKAITKSGKSNTK